MESTLTSRAGGETDPPFRRSTRLSDERTRRWLRPPCSGARVLSFRLENRCRIEMGHLESLLEQGPVVELSLLIRDALSESPRAEALVARFVDRSRPLGRVEPRRLPADPCLRGRDDVLLDGDAFDHAAGAAAGDEELAGDLLRSGTRRRRQRRPARGLSLRERSGRSGRSGRRRPLRLGAVAAAGQSERQQERRGHGESSCAHPSIVHAIAARRLGRPNRCGPAPTTRSPGARSPSQRAVLPAPTPRADDGGATD